MGTTYFLWACVCIAKSVALAGSTIGRNRNRFAGVAIYLGFGLFTEFVEFVAFRKFGYSSVEYRYSYFLTDLAMTIAGYVLLVHLLRSALSRASINLPGLRIAAAAIVVGIAVITEFLVTHSRTVTLDFGVEFEQNLEFAGVLLALLLWATVNALRVPGVQFRRVVLALGVMYSSGTAVYALRQLVGRFASWGNLVQVTSLAGILLLAYTLWTIEPEETPIEDRGRILPAGVVR